MENLQNYPLKPFPKVYLDVSTEINIIGRITIELSIECPKTSENFRCLCTGEKGKSNNGHKLHYRLT